MKKLLFLTFFLSTLHAQNNYTLTLDALLHSENSQILNENNSSANENASYSTLFTQLQTSYDITKNLYLNAGAKANYIYYQDDFTLAQYQYYKTDANRLNKAFISEASLNFEKDLLSLNAGRLDINFPWLQGSLDGAVMMYGDDKRYSLRFLYAKNITQMSYNYYAEHSNILQESGMFGSIAKLDYHGFEANIFEYSITDKSYQAGIHTNYTAKNFALTLNYMDYFNLEKTQEESLTEAALELLFGSHYLQVGASLTSKNPLYDALTLGYNTLSSFYLNNNIDRSNAKNIFARYIYADKKFSFEGITGTTLYDNSYAQALKNLQSFESDITISYNFTKNFSLDFTALYLKVDKQDPLQNSQALFMSNLEYTYESF